MRKRRRLANKLTIFVCAVLFAVSAFFYAPMEVSAEEIVTMSLDSGVADGVLMSTEEIVNITGNVPNVTAQQLYYRYIDVELGSFDLKNYYELDDDVLYQVDVTMDAFYQANAPRVFLFPATFILYNSVKYLPLDRMSVDGTGNVVTKSDTFTLLFYGSDSEFNVRFYSSLYSPEVTSLGADLGTSFSFSNFKTVSSSNSDDYQNGYNAGYSAGQQAGYGNGYSNGFADGEASVDTDAIYNQGFQAGKDSVDTDSYYDVGYQAGYQVGVQESYDIGYQEGYQSAMDRIDGWGADTADYPVIVYENSFSNSKVLCDINTNIPQISYGNFYFPQFNFAVNPNHTYKVVFNSSTYTKASAHASGSQSDNIVYNLGSLELPWYIGESCAFIPGSQFTSNVRLDCYIYGAVYDDGSNSSNFETWSAQYVLTFKSIDIKVYDMGPSGDTQNHIANQTDSLTNGFDNSQGNSVNSDLSSGLNEYQASEDTLWATATTGLKDFTFFDFASVPAMITGMSFITAIMGSWFNQAGGASGVGIVLSILFSVVLVAMVLGLYRWYQSRGGKD